VIFLQCKKLNNGNALRPSFQTRTSSFPFPPPTLLILSLLDDVHRPTDTAPRGYIPLDSLNPSHWRALVSFPYGRAPTAAVSRLPNSHYPATTSSFLYHGAHQSRPLCSNPSPYTVHSGRHSTVPVRQLAIRARGHVMYWLCTQNSCPATRSGDDERLHSGDDHLE
jgi:hypothetical protein